MIQWYCGSGRASVLFYNISFLLLVKAAYDYVSDLGLVVRIMM
jgi:hypothetical protein